MFHKNSSYFKCSRQPSNCWRSLNHEKKKEEGAADAETVCIGLARVGADTQGRHVTDLIRVLLDFVLFKVNSDE